MATSSAWAAPVTIGQLAPGIPAAVCSAVGRDDLTPTVTDGNSYVVPSAGTITSWSTNAAAGAGQMMTMKVFRLVSGTTYSVVGHDGPRSLTAGTLNTFPASVPVQPGDVLGVTQIPGSTACLFAAVRQPWIANSGNLADGASAAFATQPPGYRPNVTAVLTQAPGVTGRIGAVRCSAWIRDF